MLRTSMMLGILGFAGLGFYPPQRAKGELITFEEMGAAPCLFAQTGPLREQYAGLGVHFSGPAALDGGAILDQCGNFGINAKSGVNFLAFNRFAVMNNGGVPQPPQTISFDMPQTFVSIWLGGGSQFGRFRMDAFNASGSIVDSAFEYSGSKWRILKVSGIGIVRVVIDQQHGEDYFVMDDLSFGARACTGFEFLDLNCTIQGCASQDKVKARVYEGNPGQLLTFCLNGSDCKTAKVKGSGRAKGKAVAEWCVPPGSTNTVTVVECGLSQQCNAPDSMETFVPFNNGAVGGVEVDRATAD